MATVNKTHSDYDDLIDRWVTCNDVSAGQHAVHKKGERYLPRLREQSDYDYRDYKNRTLFYNATWRTIAGLQGLIFRKNPVVTVSSSLEKLLLDVTLEDQSIFEFCYELTEQMLTTGRTGILVSYPEQSTDGMTQADVSRYNLRPYLKIYDADTIINWRYGTVNNLSQLTMIVLVEDYEEQLNEFQTKCEKRYRVLDIDNGRYRVRVFRINDKDEDELISEVWPIMNGQYLDYIPFVIDQDVDDPPLIDLVYANLSHYQMSSSYENGCFRCGIPQPWISGYTAETGGEKLSIGANTAWVFSDPQAKVGYLEFTGSGLGSLENNLTRKEQMMAVLGARMLSADKKGVEAADTAAIYRSGENSVLAGVSRMLSKQISKALSIMDTWIGGNGDATIQLNTDFFEKSLTPQEATAYIQLIQSGTCSHEAIFDNMQIKGFYPDELTFEEEQARIDTNPQIPTP
jgi:hypothetical protein